MTNPDGINSDSDHKLSDGWRYWKSRQGSAENGSRKLSSIDPLECPVPQNNQEQIAPASQESTTITQQISINENEGHVPKIQNVPSQTSRWGNFWNPLTYIPTETFKFPSVSLQPSNIENDQLSTRSQSTSISPQNSTSWFSWMWPGTKSQPNDLDDESEEGGTQDLVTSIELKKSTKEYKKLVAANDSCWAWYQNHYNSNQFNGEVSVLGTKSETSPIELSKYPVETIPLAQSTLESKDGVIVPDLETTYRTITRRTKVRLGAQLYYNFSSAEKHLYIKQNDNKPEIKYILVISIVCNNNSKQPRSFSAKQLSDTCVEAMNDVFNEKVDEKGEKIEYQVESISLEVGKIKESVIEDLFKLLINWRVDFKKIDFLFVNGFKQTFPLACQLLQILLSRGLMDNVKKIGLFGIESIVPGSDSIVQKTNNGSSTVANTTLTELSEIESFPWSKNFDLIVSELISKYNVKLTFLGSHFNLSSTLGIQLFHPNIFRCLFIRNPNNPFSNSAPSNTATPSEVVDKFNNEFEIQLLKLVLTSHNLGHQSSRLLIQLTKYFQPVTVSSQYAPSLSENLTPEFFKNALSNVMKTTNLIKNQALKINRLDDDDDIINNEYNLVWTLHAFLNDYKTLANVNALLGIKILVGLYHTWNPRGKGLVDLKYMLEVLKIEDYSGAIFKDCTGVNLD